MTFKSGQYLDLPCPYCKEMLDVRLIEATEKHKYFGKLPASYLIQVDLMTGAANFHECFVKRYKEVQS